MSKLTLALLLIAVAAAVLPQTGGATNYHVYKKFAAEGQLSRCNVHLKKHQHHCHCEEQWEFWSRD
jgi:hypothetical protein